MEAMQLPMCTKGPSFPKSRPADTAPMLPIIYTSKYIGYAMTIFM